METEVGLLWSS